MSFSLSLPQHPSGAAGSSPGLRGAAALGDAAPGHRVFLETFGCQMNELDSELVRGHLLALGYRFTPEAEEADVVLFNTCSVREHAEQKVWSRLGLLEKRKKCEPGLVIGVLGCLAEREGLALIRKFPHVDLMCGPGELDKLPALLRNATSGVRVAIADRMALQGATARRSATLEAAEDSLEVLDLGRAFDPDRAHAAGRSAYVRITRGCNKFCTYCVVPNTRGPEIHRPPEAILEECRRLVDAGVIEITLLGQTVNHYLYVHGTAVGPDGQERPQVGPGAAAFSSPRTFAAGKRVTTFADLLHQIHDRLPALRRLRFLTSYPRDFGDDVLHVMAASPRICRYLHAPAQSGADSVLKRMNRGYTREQYLDFAARARAIVPDISIAGDFIVGFCGETDDEYAQTRTLLERVGFKNSFIFKYSPRPGTAAMSRFPDDVPDEVKRYRNNDLLALQARVSAAEHEKWVGKQAEVFVEQVTQREAGGAAVQVQGRTSGDMIAVFAAPDEATGRALIGELVTLEITGAQPLLLRGELVSTGSPR